MSKSQIDQMVERMQGEILAHVAQGRIPTNVASFADLHNHVDANIYGGLTDDDVFDALLLQFGGRDKDDGMPQGMLEFINLAQFRVHEWIVEGGISGLRAPGPAGKSEITAGPWGSTPTMSSDLYAIRYITGPTGQSIAKIEYRLDMSQDEALANAKAIKAVPDLLATLKLIESELSQHPEFTKGNSKVHFAVHKARSAIASAT